MSGMPREGGEARIKSMRPADRAITRPAKQTGSISRILVVLLLCAALIHGNQAEAAITLTQLTNVTGYDSYGPSVNADGTRIAFESNNDLTGGNPDANPEIFLWTEGSGIAEVTSTTVGASFGSSINADGTRIAFSSSADLTGGNADYNQEIFLWILAPASSKSATHSVAATATIPPSMPTAPELPFTPLLTRSAATPTATLRSS